MLIGVLALAIELRSIVLVLCQDLLAESDASTILTHLVLICIVVELEVALVLSDAEHVRRYDVAQVRQDVDGLVELLLQHVGLRGSDAYLDPLRRAHMGALVALDQSLLSYGLELRKQLLGFLLELVGCLLGGLAPLLFRLKSQPSLIHFLALVEALDVVPELQIVRDDLRVFLDQFLEAIHRSGLISQGMGVNVRLQQETAWSIYLLFKSAQYREVLLCQLLLSWIQSVILALSSSLDASIDHVNDQMHERILVQEALDQPLFLLSLDWRQEAVALGIVPIVHGFQRHFLLHICIVVCKADVVLDPAVELRHAGLQALFHGADAAAQELPLNVQTWSLQRI